MAALTMATYGSESLIIRYPLFPWLAMMVLGWAFGRHLIRRAAELSNVPGTTILWVPGAACLVAFVVVRGLGGYGNMFLQRADGSWQQWLHVSKYPPSLSYALLELGILSLALAAMRALELRIGVRGDGPFYVFGQTSMFFYIVHRLVLEVPATYFGLRGAGRIVTTYVVAAVLLVLLYPACRWYRSVKAAHPRSILKYL